MVSAKSPTSRKGREKWGTRLVPDTLVQLFSLLLSGLIGGRYEYERNRISG
jgi:hypothetical protein